jgi:hypothetical protein
MHPRALLTNQSVVPHVVRRERQSVMVAEAAVTGLGVITQLHARCFRLYVPLAVKKPRYPFNPVVTNQSIVQIVTARTNQQEDINISKR